MIRKAWTLSLVLASLTAPQLLLATEAQPQVQVIRMVDAGSETDKIEADFYAVLSYLENVAGPATLKEPTPEALVELDRIRTVARRVYNRSWWAKFFGISGGITTGISAIGASVAGACMNRTVGILYADNYGMHVAVGAPERRNTGAKVGLGFAIAGVVAGIGSMILGVVKTPGDQEINNIVSMYNNLGPKRPLEISDMMASIRRADAEAAAARQTSYYLGRKNIHGIGKDLHSAGQFIGNLIR